MKSIRFTRALLLINPLRAVRLRQLQRTHSQRTPLPRYSDFELQGVNHQPLSPSNVAQDLGRDGVSTGYCMDEDSAEALLADLTTNNAKRLVNKLAQNDFLLDSAKAYLGAEPIIACIYLRDEQPSDQPPKWHFDVSGLRSVSVFLYLSPHTERDGGYHQCVPGSHRDPSPLTLFKRFLHGQNPASASILKVAGDVGTLFFEDTEVMHAKSAHSGIRKILQIQYCIGKPILGYLLDPPATI